MILERIFIFRKSSHRYFKQDNKNQKQNKVSVFISRNGEQSYKSTIIK